MEPRSLVIWRHGDWRCECHSGLAGNARLEVYHGVDLAMAETTVSGRSAYLRAEVLRQRLMRGDLGPSTTVLN